MQKLRQDALKIRLGAKNIYLSNDEKDKKEIADIISINTVIHMITEKNGSFICEPYTKEDIFYTVTCNKNYLSICHCPDPSRLPRKIDTLYINPNTTNPSEFLKDFNSSCSRLTTKLNKFSKEYKNNDNSLLKTNDNVKILENILDSAHFPNSAPNK
ncbi:unnamed protein product [Cunninghamella blakesleeana]